MWSSNDYCEAHAEWSRRHGGHSRHAYNHSAKPRGDYCFWCGVHRNGSHTMKPQAEGYSEDDWWNDAIQFGFQLED